LLPLGEWVSSSLSCPPLFSYSSRYLTRSRMKELTKRCSFIEDFPFYNLLFLHIRFLRDPNLLCLSRLLLLLMPWNKISGKRSMMPGRLLLRWRTPGLDMTVDSTLVIHGSFMSLPVWLLSLIMRALRSDMPKLTTMMACVRLSFNRRLGLRLRDN
jgi:hypothetical protein